MPSKSTFALIESRLRRPLRRAFDIKCQTRRCSEEKNYFFFFFAFLAFLAGAFFFAFFAIVPSQG